MQSNQLTLSPADSEAVRQLAQRTGKTEAEILHEAVEKLMQQASADSRLTALRQARGMWENRTDLPDFNQVRTDGWDYAAAPVNG
jgi:hypothetical protein